MGRLTLNVLLSFAQFEREVTGERIRDKVAASKKKGMWMGGPVPIGYLVQDRKLVIAEIKATTVRHIFERYAAVCSMPVLVDELGEQGIRTKLRTFKDGRQFGGVPFTVGTLSYLLNNPVYVCEVRHKGVSHPGQHEPIISRQLWAKVQTILASGRVERRVGGKGRAPSLLTGMLRCRASASRWPRSSTRRTCSSSGTNLMSRAPAASTAPESSLSILLGAGAPVFGLKRGDRVIVNVGAGLRDEDRLYAFRTTSGVIVGRLGVQLSTTSKRVNLTGGHGEVVSYDSGEVDVIGLVAGSIQAR